ncbi:MAG: hypothetical protein L6R36_007073 [Xanthoria steineri]|nr:MAG: hypothetical protein L6R36_007073 [Xanthoria steineri]
MSAILSRRGAISEGMPSLKIPTKDEIDAMSLARSASAEQEDTVFSTAVSRVTQVEFWADRNRVVRRSPVMRDDDGISPLHQHSVQGTTNNVPGIVSQTTIPEKPSSAHERLADASAPQLPAADSTSNEESGERQSTRLWNAVWSADNINRLEKYGEVGDKQIHLLEEHPLELQKSYDSMSAEVGEKGKQIESLDIKIRRKRDLVKTAREEELELVRSTKRKLEHGLEWLEKKQLKLS